MLSISDKNSDAVIDRSNPIYNELMVMTFDKNKKEGSQLVFMSLEKAGIQKVILNGRYVSYQPNQRNKNTNTIAGKVIMANGAVTKIEDIAS